MTLPLALGGRAIHPFDLFFLACLVVAWRRAAFRAPDSRLIASGLGLVAAFAIPLAAHLSIMDVDMLRSIAYSVVVLLSISHVRFEKIPVRVELVILLPLFLGTAAAWIIFFAENLGHMEIGFDNNSGALPSGQYRLGGITGGNVLILFLCLAAPFVRGFGWSLIAVLIPAWATLSRSMMGVGTALLLRYRLRGAVERRTSSHYLNAAAVLTIGVSLGIYAFVAPTDRASFHPTFGKGAYVYLHANALRLFWGSPLFGVGTRGFIVQSHGWAPHSTLLGLAAQQGLLGLAGFGWLAFEVVSRLVRCRDAEWRALTLAAAGGLMVGGLFVDWLLLKGIWFWLGLLVSESHAHPSRHPTDRLGSAHVPATLRFLGKSVTRDFPAPRPKERRASRLNDASSASREAAL